MRGTSEATVVVVVLCSPETHPVTGAQLPMRVLQEVIVSRIQMHVREGSEFLTLFPRRLRLCNMRESKCTLVEL